MVGFHCYARFSKNRSEIEIPEALLAIRHISLFPNFRFLLNGGRSGGNLRLPEGLRSQTGKHIVSILTSGRRLWPMLLILMASSEIYNRAERSVVRPCSRKVFEWIEIEYCRSRNSPLLYEWADRHC